MILLTFHESLIITLDYEAFTFVTYILYSGAGIVLIVRLYYSSEFMKFDYLIVRKNMLPNFAVNNVFKKNFDSISDYLYVSDVGNMLP